MQLTKIWALIVKPILWASGEGGEFLKPDNEFLRDRPVPLKQNRAFSRTHGWHYRSSVPAHGHAFRRRSRGLGNDRQRMASPRAIRPRRCASRVRALVCMWCSSRAAKRAGFQKAHASPRARKPTSSTSTWAVRGQRVTAGEAGAALSAQSRIRRSGLPGSGRRRGERSGHAEDAARLGRAPDRGAGSRAARGSGGRCFRQYSRSHARAVLWNGGADWNAIGCVKAAVNIPLAANGDLTSYEDAIMMRKCPAPTP